MKLFLSVATAVLLLTAIGCAPGGERGKNRDLDRPALDTRR